jgi:hypothetical protein
MAMRNTLSDRDFFVASGRAEHDSKVFDRTMSDDMTIKSPKQVLTAKTAPVTVRPRREDRDLRNAFAYS